MADEGDPLWVRAADGALSVASVSVAAGGVASECGAVG